jgi:hypothetical protein
MSGGLLIAREIVINALRLCRPKAKLCFLWMKKSRRLIGFSAAGAYIALPDRGAILAPLRAIPSMNSAPAARLAIRAQRTGRANEQE